jgi:hypothetical protein
MAGEEVACPRCGQRILTPAAGRMVERALPANAPPPIPRRTNFPDTPVVLEPPEPGVRIGIPHDEQLTPTSRPIATRLVAVLMIGGGVWAFVHVIGFTIRSGGLCCFWPLMFLELPWGIAAIVRGGQLLMTRGRPRVPAIIVCLQLLTCGGFDLVNTFLGVLNVLLICAPKSRGYFRNEWGDMP